MTSSSGSAWQHRDFRFLVSGRVVDMLGNAMAPVALAFAVLDLTGSGADLGLVVAARSVANVALVLYGGVLADRWRRSTVLVWSNVLSALSQATVAAMVLTGTATVPWLLVLSVVNGAAAATSMPAAAALVPQTVGAGELGQANAITRLGSSAASMAGAALGGVLVAAAGPGWGLAADAASFLVAAGLYAAVRVTPTRTAAASAWQDLTEGWHAFTSRTWIWVVVVMFAAVNMALAGCLQVVGPVVADATVGRAGWGVALGALTGGMALGALLALRWQPRRPLRTGIALSTTLVALPLTLALAPRMVVLVPAFLLAGACLETFAIAWDTSLQRHVPPDRLARVFAYDLLGSLVAIPLGQALAGPLVDVVGPRPVLLAAAAAILIGALGALASRSVREVRATPAHTDPPPTETTPTLVG